MSSEDFLFDNKPPRSTNWEKTPTESERLAKEAFATKAGKVSIESLARYAALKPGTINATIADLRDPQKSDFYQAAEGFDEFFEDKDEHTLPGAVAEVRSSGVEQMPDGAYALRHNGSTHLVTVAGIPHDRGDG